MTTLNGLTLNGKRTWRTTIDALVSSWEIASSILLVAIGIRFVSWRWFEGQKRDPFADGLFEVMHDITSVPEVWALLMFASLPAAVWITIWGSLRIRIMHRFWIAFVWGMFAGANIPAGLERSLTNFGVTILWALVVISVCQTYAIVDRALEEGER